MVALLVATTTSTSPSPGPISGTGAFYAVLVALVTAAGVLIGQLLLRRQQKDKLIAEASSEVAEGARTLLEQYRQELSRCVQASTDLRERVAVLERDLAEALTGHADLRRKREEALTEMGRMSERVRFLEAQIKQLEQVSLKRYDDPPAAVHDETGLGEQ